DFHARTTGRVCQRLPAERAEAARVCDASRHLAGFVEQLAAAGAAPGQSQSSSAAVCRSGVAGDPPRKLWSLAIGGDQSQELEVAGGGVERAHSWTGSAGQSGLVSALRK